MAEWKPLFERGISNFRLEKYEEALECFNESVAKGGSVSQLFDSRAAVHEKLGDLKAALEDARKAIDSAPQKWQGYARCARLFLRLKKPERAARVVDYALERVKPSDTARRGTLLALKQETVELVAAIKRHISRSSYHFGSIPVEISHEIFSLLAHSDHTLVLTVAAVCNAWRSVALASPSFWFTLVLTKKRPAKKVKVWSQRSGGRILDLTFVEGCLSDPMLSQSFQGFRWEVLRTLDIQVNVMEILTPVRDSVLRLDLLRITDSHSARHLLNLLSKAQTRNLDLVGNHIQFHEVRQVLADCRALSIQALGQFHIPEILQTISENPNLTTLSMSLTGHLLMGPAPLQSVDTVPESLDLPNLRQLDVKSSQLLATHLFRMAMPSLTSLTLSELPGIGGPLADFLTHHPITTLTNLTISRCAASHHQLTPLLRASPQLRTIVLEGISDINELVEFLAVPQPDDRGPSCPFLEKLDLTSCVSLTSGPIVRLIKGRAMNEGVVAIGTLLINYCPLIEPEVRDWLSRNVPSFSCVYTRKKDTRLKR